MDSKGPGKDGPEALGESWAPSSPHDTGPGGEAHAAKLHVCALDSEKLKKGGRRVCDVQTWELPAPA